MQQGVERVEQRARRERLLQEVFHRFAASEDHLVWSGSIAGPDRLRFLGMTSRYIAFIDHISLTEVKE